MNTNSHDTLSRNKRINVVTFAWAGWIFDFYDLILYSFLLVWIMPSFNLSLEETALIYSFSLAITAVGGITLGWLGDRIGRRSAIILSVFIFSFGTLLSAFAWDLWSLLFFRLITGFGIGGEWAAGHTLVNETLPKGERGKASSIIQSGAPLGAGMASFMGGWITPIIGWRASFLLASVPSFILVALMLKFLPESPRFAIFKAESKDKRSDKEITPHGAAYVRSATKRSYSYLWDIRKTLVLGTILSLFGMLGYWVIFSFSPKYLKDLSYSNAEVGFWMLIANTGAFIGYISFGFIADYINNFKVTFASFALTFAIGAFLFTNGTTINFALLAIIGIFLTGLGTGFFSGYGPLYSKIFPTSVRNTSSSFCFNMGRMGAFVAPLLVTQASLILGMGGALSIASLFGVLVALWVFVIPMKDQLEDLGEFEVQPIPTTKKIVFDVSGD
jgi:MFS family permease